MIRVDGLAWKRAMQGMHRGDAGPFIQRNRIEGEYSVMEFFDGEEVVGRATTHDLFDGATFPWDQVHELAVEWRDATAYIYIPTQEEYELWNDMESEQNRDVSSEEIAKREGRVFAPPVRKGPIT